MWKDAPQGATSVAVKLFKGAVTSDGLPRSEKAACIAAGAHPNLISATGRVHAHPEGVAGLVMPLIAPAFKNLAGAPSLESCTRDIYPEDARFSLDNVLGMAHGIAAAAEHLHERGIMHGDLYAHNMLWNGRGDCLLGDFGAASFIPQQANGLAQSLQRIEVRAFACFLEELLERCAGISESPETFAAVKALQHRCAQAEPAVRPLFAEIRKSLAAMLNQP